jgi:hypothetical protein
MGLLDKIKSLFVKKQGGINARAQMVGKIAARVKRAGSDDWEDLGIIYDSSKKSKEGKKSK